MLKRMIQKLLSFVIYPELDERKKIAIQIACLDGLASLFVILLYFLYSIFFKIYPLVYFHLAGLLLSCLGLYLLKYRYYDLGRILLHLVGLSEIFMTVDGMGINSGYEYYYFITIAVPFLSFTTKEMRKSIVLSSLACLVFFSQQILGPGLFVTVVTPPSGDRLISMTVVLFYVLSLLLIFRWLMNKAQRKNKFLQK